MGRSLHPGCVIVNCCVQCGEMHVQQNIKIIFILGSSCNTDNQMKDSAKPNN